MSDFKINDWILEKEAEELAKMIMLEINEYGGDKFDLACQMVDGHEWIIYYHKAIQICANCNTDSGEDYLEDMGLNSFDSFNDHATKLAYATLLNLVYEKLTELEDEEG